MKIIFLDFDGVMHVYGKASSYDLKFSSIAVKNLNHLLLEILDLKIVISSSWRHKGLAHCKEILKNNGIDPDKAINVLGNENGDRGYHIKCFLEQRPEINNFVIFDDDSDVGEYMNKLIKTNGFIGLTESDVKKAIKILNNT